MIYRQIKEQQNKIYIYTLSPIEQKPFKNSSQTLAVFPTLTWRYGQLSRLHTPRRK